MPDINLPFVLIITHYPGASPEAVETDVTKPIEYAVNQVAGVKMIRSNCSRDAARRSSSSACRPTSRAPCRTCATRSPTVRPAFPKT